MDAKIKDALRAAVGESIVFDDANSLTERRYDYWCVSHWRDWSGQVVPVHGAIVRPTGVIDVQKIVRFARDHRIPLQPFGLGSGVLGGVIGDPSTILVDLSVMKRVRQIDTQNQLAQFDAGLNGLEAENAVAAEGLTIGHWPQSIALSSVGGWVSTRASGQFSTANGNIEDIVYSIEAVLPDGDLVILGKAPRAAAGPDLRHLLMGAEGTMGIITGVTLQLRRQAERREYTAFHTGTMEQGFEAQRRIVHADWWPPVMRQYDAREVKRSFPDHARGDQPLLIMVHEGPKARVETELAAIRVLAADAGLTEAAPSAVSRWMDRRNQVHPWVELFEKGVIADTIEVSGKWSDIGLIYRNVMAALKTVPDISNASAHSSHVYGSGINIYCTFACRPKDSADMEKRYFECWDRALEATAAAGGGIAHHHGAGRLRKPYLHHELGEQGIALLRNIKNAVDPVGIMNPGNLLPDA